MDDDKQFNSVYKISKSPTGKQKTRLHELISEHVEILSSSADDEPLKSRIWLNIAEELNKLSKNGPCLSPKAWQKFVDWHKYTVRRGRKPTKRSTSIVSAIHAKRLPKNVGIVKKEDRTDSDLNILYISSRIVNRDGQFEIVNETKLKHKSAKKMAVKKLYYDQSHVDENIIKNNEPEDEVGSMNNDVKVLLRTSVHIKDNVMVSNKLINENNYTDIAALYRNVKKNINLPPIVRSFTYSQRIVKYVDKLGNDVNQIQKQLKKTVNNVNRLERTMQKQIIEHQRTNLLLKRNTQFLKILAQRKFVNRTTT